MYGSYRTDRLWAAVGISLGVLLVGTLVALGGMLEFGERCSQGLTEGPGRLLRTRNQAFPPATVCEFESGDVSSIGGRGPLNLVLWAGLAVLVACLLVALVADCLEPPLGGPFVLPVTRAAKLRHTRTVLLVLGSVFLMFYALNAWRLLAGPSAACARGADWGSNPPTTEGYSLFPPQATCRYTSGATSRINPEWAVSLTVELAVPALLAGIAHMLARRRHAAPGRSRGSREA
ncbi:hypothetical protein ABZX85_49010 [Streptomyces sp. NPDC004539]|uniref:hypothetical protein n=1 Tax=Streptomyces sp. NPDC004539 TaxID=3154280 RepID=UPI0033A9F3BF